MSHGLYDVYEYHVLAITSPDQPSAADELERKLNEFGKLGWEVVGTRSTYIILKRKVATHEDKKLLKG